MKDTSMISMHGAKVNLFIWEVIITAIVFTAAYFVLKGFKNGEKNAKEKNKIYETGSKKNRTEK